jgi:hypothetical protein
MLLAQWLFCTSFRQLHSGADALKLASQLLVSIDKFTNLHDDADKRD